MDNFYRMLIENNTVLLDINVFSDDDNVSLTSVAFNVHDVYLDADNNKLLLTQENGSVLTLPIQGWQYLGEDFGDSWKVVYKNLNFYIYVEELN